MDNYLMEWFSSHPYITIISSLVLATLSGWGLVSLYLRWRKPPTKGKMLSWKERVLRRKADILIEGDRRRNPKYIQLTIRNTGKRSLDFNAPVIIFKRWSSQRKFRINSFGRVDEFPLWLEPGYESIYNVELELFYERIPILRRACRISTEIKEVSGKKFTSKTIRIRLI